MMFVVESFDAKLAIHVTMFLEPTTNRFLLVKVFAISACACSSIVSLQQSTPIVNLQISLRPAFVPIDKA